jgi:hypothetical protein
MDIERKTWDIRKWGKHLFLDIVFKHPVAFL